MNETDAANQISTTYKTLRLCLAVLAFLFPVILAVGAYWHARLPLAAALSAYYHIYDPAKLEYGKGIMRDAFVGILFAEAALLLVYKGFTRLEDRALNLAALMAVGIAVVPMDWPIKPEGNFFTPHGLFAIGFFICLAYVCIWRAKDTLPLIPDAHIRKIYEQIYKGFGFAMIGLPILVSIFVANSPFGKSVVFFIEVASIYVFAGYWLVKSSEASRTNLDKKAAKGELLVPPHGIKDMFSELPVCEKSSG